MHWNHFLIFGIVISILAPLSTESTLNDVRDDNKSTTEAIGESLVFYQGVEGTPGVDFPIFSHIPKTIFSCKGIESGYYADLDTDCQVFHICEEEKKISFLCPNGTIFQQSDLICEWWFKVNCSNSPNLYVDSAEHLRDDAVKRKSSRRVKLNGLSHGAVMRTEEFSSTSVKRPGEKVERNHRSQNISTQNKYTDRNSLRSVNSFRNKNSEINTSTPSTSNGEGQLLRKYGDRGSSHTKIRRFNDEQTGNHLNNDYGNRKIIKEENSRSEAPKYQEKSHTRRIPKEYHVQFPISSSSEIDSTTNTPDITHSKNAHVMPLYHDKERENHESKKYPHSDSDETQITQESASFAKSSFNRINDGTFRYSTVNPYPNHKTTYSDLSTPKHSTTNILGMISSVTPQYITTQPLYNGKPFLGSRVGIDIFTTKMPFSSSTSSFNVLETEPQSGEKASQNSHQGYVKVTNSDQYRTSAPPLEEAEVSTKGENEDSYYNDRSTSTLDYTFDNTESTTNSFVMTDTSLLISSTVTPFSDDSNIAESLKTSPATAEKVSKQYYWLANSNVASNNPQPTKKATTYSTNFESSTRRTIDYATVYGSYTKENLATPVPPSFKNAIQIKFDKNVSKVGVHLTKSITGSSPKPVLKNTAFATSPRSNKAPRHFEKSEDIITNNSEKRPTSESLKIKNSYQAVTIPATSDDAKVDSVPGSSDDDGFKNNSPTPRSVELVTTSSYPPTTAHPVLYILLKNSPKHARPAESHRSSSFSRSADPPTSYSYKISTASPFRHAVTPAPTQPTPFTTAAPSIRENIDNMIETLTKLSNADDPTHPSETPRPGLVVPPSVGPQTLRTLAVYFENALELVSSNKNTSSPSVEDEVTKEKLTDLLTEMTRYGYDKLFDENQGNQDGESTTVAGGTTVDEDDNGLETQNSENLVQSAKIRELARNFTLALSSYLNDPHMFRKDLEDLRPTEPSYGSFDENSGDDDKTKNADEELLNFSDSDSKLSLPAIFSTTSPPSPTWSFIVAPNEEVENSLNPDLNTADSQSFVPSYNSLNADSKYNNINSKPDNLLQNHWTTSPSATKLWRSTFSINPAVVNDNLEITTPNDDITDSTEDVLLLDSSEEIDEKPEEIKYALRTLPKLTLNSTEVHGLLIDFLNTTENTPNVLQNVLKRLNISEDEFLTKMKGIEENPLTRRLILLLISECGMNASRNASSDDEKGHLGRSSTYDSSIADLVDPTLTKDNHDARALQLLNALYSIASKFS